MCVLLSLKLKQEEMINKHCVLITAYKDSRLINRIISQLPEDFGKFVHIDKKSDISETDINADVVLKQHKIYWGGAFEHIEAFLDLLKIALEDR